ncbi:MAG: tyrosine-protein phosphatase [Phycisphaerae bacterium]
MPERIDVHNHLLPNLDDGCASLDDSFECLRGLMDAGYRRLFLTPHTGPTDMCSIRPEESLEHFEKFSAAARKAGFDVELKLGGEVRLSPELLAMRDLTLAVTYGLKSSYCLVDIWEPDWPQWAQDCIDWLHRAGRTVILAHPERMPIMQKDIGLMDRLASKGVLFQGNLAPLGGSESEPIRLLAEQFLRDGRYFMLGTDCHRPSHLPARLAGLQRATEIVGEAAVNRLTYDNPMKIWLAS